MSFSLAAPVTQPVSAGLMPAVQQPGTNGPFLPPSARARLHTVFHQPAVSQQQAPLFLQPGMTCIQDAFRQASQAASLAATSTGPMQPAYQNLQALQQPAGPPGLPGPFHSVAMAPQPQPQPPPQPPPQQHPLQLPPPLPGGPPLPSLSAVVDDLKSGRFRPAPNSCMDINWQSRVYLEGAMERGDLSAFVPFIVETLVTLRDRETDTTAATKFLLPPPSQPRPGQPTEEEWDSTCRHLPADYVQHLRLLLADHPAGCRCAPCTSNSPPPTRLARHLLVTQTAVYAEPSKGSGEKWQGGDYLPFWVPPGGGAYPKWAQWLKYYEALADLEEWTDEKRMAVMLLCGNKTVATSAALSPHHGLALHGALADSVRRGQSEADQRLSSAYHLMWDRFATMMKTSPDSEITVTVLLSILKEGGPTAEALAGMSKWVKDYRGQQATAGGRGKLGKEHPSTPKNTSTAGREESMSPGKKKSMSKEEEEKKPQTQPPPPRSDKDEAAAAAHHYDDPKLLPNDARLQRVIVVGPSPDPPPRPRDGSNDSREGRPHFFLPWVWCGWNNVSIPLKDRLLNVTRRLCGPPQRERPPGTAPPELGAWHRLEPIFGAIRYVPNQAMHKSHAAFLKEANGYDRERAGQIAEIRARLAMWHMPKPYWDKFVESVEKSAYPAQPQNEEFLRYFAVEMSPAARRERLHFPFFYPEALVIALLERLSQSFSPHFPGDRFPADYPYLRDDRPDEYPVDFVRFDPEVGQALEAAFASDRTLLRERLGKTRHLTPSNR